MPMNRSLSIKNSAELAFWQNRQQQQGVLTNTHFEYFYTTQFGLEKTFYCDKKILDIGCGPRGSLEWADVASLCVGVDPLADAYRQLGTDPHRMNYVACGAETLPFPNTTFDVVCSFNSLDHVDDLGQVITEIQRMLVSGGLFLLITDIHHQPTVLEPHAYSWDIVDGFLPGLEVIDQKQIEHTVFGPEGFSDIYRSLQQGTPYDHNNLSQRSGVLAVKFCKNL